MTSSRPYLIRAIYEWLTDNNLTPYIMLDASAPGLLAPQNYVEDGKLVLNVEHNAIGNLRIGNDAIEFDARFGGVAKHIYAPIQAVKAIYARENSRGMVFSDEEDEDDGSNSPPDDEPKPPAKKGKPQLRIVK